MKRTNWLFRLLLALALSAAHVLLTSTPSGAATTWWVDAADPACVDKGGGSADRPFCTLTAAAKLAGPGDTVLARPATYREQVTVVSSGADGSPVTFRAAGPGVLVLGTLDLSDDDGWQPGSGTAWLRPYAPPSAPRQVFVDDQRLVAATDVTSLTPGSFYYDALNRVLHVDVGGPNPGDGRAVEAGARTYGFNVAGRSHVVVAGFELRGQNNHGVRIHSSSDVAVDGVQATATGVNGVLVEAATGPVTVTRSEVSAAGSAGIRLFRTSGAAVRGNRSHDNGFHGIALAAASGNTVEGNHSYRNRVVGGRSTASGIDVNRNVEGSLGNVIVGNVVWENQDSGIQVYNGSHDNVLVRNVSHGNGDHGFDTLASTGVRYVSNTSYGNRKDGFSVEGGSTSTSMANNIAAQNGLSTGSSDLYVDQASTAGFSADHDLLWRSTSGNVSFGGTRYADLLAFRAATGHELHGLAADPAFELASAGDLRLKDRSPALDAADTGTPWFRGTDASGAAVADHTVVPDTGKGPVTFADIGAYEYTGPVALLSVSPSRGEEPLQVRLDAASSTVLDGSPASTYRFDCGNGTAAWTQPQPVAVCWYNAAGSYRPSVVVTSRQGQVSTAEAVVTATRNTPPKADLTVSPSSGSVPLRVGADASGSTDATGIASYRFDCGNRTGSGPQSSPRATCYYPLPGTYQLTVTVTDVAGLTGTASRPVRVKKK